MQDLPSSSQSTLLKLAKDAIVTHLKCGDTLSFEPKDESLKRHHGCFVTIYKKGELRGCVGTFTLERPLFENVIKMSILASTQDLRFSPIAKDELDDISIEISVLGKLEKVANFEEIEIGKHGICVTLGDRSGTYLPQVAEEQGWNVVEFITHCARDKAGLSPEECSKAAVQRYEVLKIS